MWRSVGRPRRPRGRQQQLLQRIQLDHGKQMEPPVSTKMQWRTVHLSYATQRVLLAGSAPSIKPCCKHGTRCGPKVMLSPPVRGNGLAGIRPTGKKWAQTQARAAEAAAMVAEALVLGLHPCLAMLRLVVPFQELGMSTESAITRLEVPTSTRL